MEDQHLETTSTAPTALNVSGVYIDEPQRQISSEDLVT